MKFPGTEIGLDSIPGKISLVTVALALPDLVALCCSFLAINAVIFTEVISGVLSSSVVLLRGQNKSPGGLVPEKSVIFLD